MEQEIEHFFKLGYSVDSSGKITNKYGIPLKLQACKSGYTQVNTWNKGKQKTFLVHRLVAFCYIENPDNLPEVNHKDGNKLNNRVENLEWVSRSQNIKHAIASGLMRKSMVGRVGSKHWRSKIVLQYLNDKLVSTFESTGDAERITGYDRRSIQDACKGRLKTYKNFIWKYQ